MRKSVSADFVEGTRAKSSQYSRYPADTRAAKKRNEKKFKAIILASPWSLGCEDSSGTRSGWEWVWMLCSCDAEGGRETGPLKGNIGKKKERKTRRSMHSYGFIMCGLTSNLAPGSEGVHTFCVMMTTVPIIFRRRCSRCNTSQQNGDHASSVENVLVH